MRSKTLRVAVFSVATVAVAGAAVRPAGAQMDPGMNQGVNPTPGTQQNPQAPQNLNLPANNSANPSQTNSQTSAQTTMRDSLGEPGQTGQQMSDKVFLHRAAEGGLAEVQLGMLASQMGGADVKVFGQKMVTDHTTINNSFKPIADSLGTMLPKKMNKDDQAEYDKLKTLSGDDFDKEYILYMVKDHRQDLRDFRVESTAAQDAALQAEAVKASGVIREHLGMLTKLATDKGVTLPPRPPRPAGN